MPIIRLILTTFKLILGTRYLSSSYQNTLAITNLNIHHMQTNTPTWLISNHKQVDLKITSTRQIHKQRKVRTNLLQTLKVLLIRNLKDLLRMTTQKCIIVRLQSTTQTNPLITSVAITRMKSQTGRVRSTWPSKCVSPRFTGT